MATLHPSVLYRKQSNASYNPKNDGINAAYNQLSVENDLN